MLDRKIVSKPALIFKIFIKKSCIIQIMSCNFSQSLVTHCLKHKIVFLCLNKCTVLVFFSFSLQVILKIEPEHCQRLNLQLICTKMRLLLNCLLSLWETHVNCVTDRSSLARVSHFSDLVTTSLCKTKGSLSCKLFSSMHQDLYFVSEIFD